MEVGWFHAKCDTGSMVVLKFSMLHWIHTTLLHSKKSALTYNHVVYVYFIQCNLQYGPSNVCAICMNCILFKRNSVTWYDDWCHLSYIINNLSSCLVMDINSLHTTLDGGLIKSCSIWTETSIPPLHFSPTRLPRLLWRLTWFTARLPWRHSAAHKPRRCLGSDGPQGRKSLAFLISPPWTALLLQCSVPNRIWKNNCIRRLN